MTQSYMPICVTCKHLSNDEDFTCTAYPNGIPFAISNNQVDHRQHYNNDNGIVFELDTEKRDLYNKIISVIGW